MLQLTALAALGLLTLFATPAFVDHYHERRTLLTPHGEPPGPMPVSVPVADAVDEASDAPAVEEAPVDEAADEPVTDEERDPGALVEHDRLEYPPDETDEG